MTYLNLKRIKGVNHIVATQSGVLEGFGRRRDADKRARQLKTEGNFKAQYFWTNKDFFFESVKTQDELEIEYLKMNKEMDIKPERG